MKVFTALLGTETNTFSPFATGYHNFETTYFVRGGQHGETPFAFGIPLVIWRNRAIERGWSVVESLATFATPAGLTRRDVYESFRDEILTDLKQALPVDAILFNMHGAMVADGYDDCEGDLIAAARNIVGPTTPIGVELDLHCHLTQTMVEQATAIITFKEYPHTDFGERAEELFQIIADTVEGKVKPHIAMYDCRMIGVFHTSTEPMRSFVDRLADLEGKAGVLSVSLGHGFPWGDVPDMGSRVLVVTDNQPEQGVLLAEQLGRELFDMRDRLQPDYLTIEQALAEITASDQGPIVLADVSDNSGGGAPNDSTFILKALLERGIENTAIACIWDPVAVMVAMEAGEGAEFDLRLGGKMGPMSGDPLDLRVKVTKIRPNAIQSFGRGKAKLGDAVALHTQGLDIVVNSHRTQTFSPEAFSNLGIDPVTKKALVVKSMQHFYADFAPIAAKILYVAAPGAMYPNFNELPYKRVNRNIWPLDMASSS
jgi:microcystin degradation protein MlrC